ncbi:hypothetical protein PYCC9005_000933 [Savitreella phatthalungensis]
MPQTKRKRHPATEKPQQTKRVRQSSRHQPAKRVKATSQGDVAAPEVPAPVQSRTASRKSTHTRTSASAAAVSKSSKDSAFIRREASNLADDVLKRMADNYSSTDNDTDSSDDDRAPPKDSTPATTPVKTAATNTPVRHVPLSDGKHPNESAPDDDDDDEDEDEDDAMWENVELHDDSMANTSADAGDVDLTIDAAERIDYTKTGARKVSARQVQERVRAHFLSCTCLLFHGALRNNWINRRSLQRVLQSKLKKSNPSLHKALVHASKNQRTLSSTQLIEWLGKAKTWFRRKFSILKPGLRRYGYRREREVQELLHDAPQHYEEFSDYKAYLHAAKLMAGSVDLGAQLFTALIRSYHLRARLVFSVQALGYKWNNAEQYSAADDDALLFQKAKESTQSSTKQKQNQPVKAAAAIDISDDSSLSSLDSDDFIDIEDDVKDVQEEGAPECYVYRKSYPIFWTEVLDHTSERWLTVDAIVFERVFVDADDLKRFQPSGREAERLKRVMGFVLAYEASGTIKDVTLRYVKSAGKMAQSFLRASPGQAAQHDIGRLLNLFKPLDDSDFALAEDEQLKPKAKPKADPKQIPETLAAMKAHPVFVIEKHLREKEALKPGAKKQGVFINGKGNKVVKETVYLRTDVLACLTVENYHKEGRRVKQGEQPRKWVKARAVTTNRRREYEQQEQETGSPVMQPIYSIDQTEYIIPPPIKDGIIPKNSYGNVDIFTPSMIPKGGAHLPYRGMARICKQLEIDHAEAVVGFDFRRRGAFPQISGVLVAEEHVETLMAAWKEAERLKRRKDLQKREQVVLARWRKFFKGLQIRKRIARDYAVNSAGPAGQQHVRGTMHHQHTTVQALPSIDTAKKEDKDDKGGITIEYTLPG